MNLGKVRTYENVFWSLAPHDIAIFQYLTDLIQLFNLMVVLFYKKST